MTGGKYDIIENGVKRMSDMEKILEILGAMNRRMDTMQEDISVLRSGSATKEDVGALKEDIAAHKRDGYKGRPPVCQGRDDGPDGGLL